ncbi:MAG: hypothetical protein Kow00124_30690 [Anaerolineae bacterium]
MSDATFDILILIARPASGKSEVIDYLKRVPAAERIRRFHVGHLREIDDFPMLWAWFEEDDILERLGRPRLHTDADGYFKDDTLWHVLIERVSLEHHKLLRDHPDLYDDHTVLIEFSRGAQHGGYREAFPHLSPEILSRAAVLYIEVTYEESLRKNRRRFNPDRPDSILQHALPDAKLERLYKEDDFRAFSAADPAWLTVNGIHVPYVVFENHDDVTTGRPDQLGERLEARLGTLWELVLRR